MLRMNNIYDGSLALSDLVYINVSDQELDTYRLKEGDLLFNRTNSPDLVGKTALFKGSGDFVCASYIVRFRLRRDLVDPRFVCYFCNTSHSQRTFHQLATKAVAQSNINPRTLQNMFRIPVPPMPEQVAIADVLDNWETAIARFQALAIAKLEFKRALMQKLLTGKIRFKEFVKSGRKLKTRYGGFPEDWSQLHISEIADEAGKRNHDGEDLPVLSCTKHRGLVNSLEYFGKRIFSEDTSNYRIVERGDFAYATNHVEEGSIGYQNLHDAALISPMYTVFRTRPGVDHEFFFKLIKTELYRHIFEVNTSGSIARRGALRWDEFALIKVFLPSEAEQKQIAAVLNTCEREIALAQKQINALKEQKYGLMQKLLTGESRVKI